MPDEAGQRVNLLRQSRRLRTTRRFEVRFLDAATGSACEFECETIFDLLRELMADS